MKKIFFLLLIMVSIAGHSQLIPKKGSDGGLFLTGLHDTTILLQLAQSPYSYFYAGNCYNLKIINDGKVELTNGFAFNDSRFIKVSGKDSFVINQHRTSWTASYAISVQGKSSDIEFDRCPIRNAGGGLWWKNEHFCDSTLSNWVLSNLSYHDAEIKDVYEHGGYIGATELINKTRPETCNGVLTYLNPSHTSGIKIYNVKISNTGKNGMMINDCRFVPAEVYNVTIDRPGRQGDPAQGQGLALGGYTKAKIKNVRIDSAKTWGLRAYGSDSLEIDSSIVTNSGYENILVSNNSYPDTTHLTACGNNVTVSIGGAVKFEKCVVIVPVPIPVPTKTIFHKGYFTLNSKRFYYVMYSDKTYAQTNSKYQPL
jgi:hypothetical protein